MTRRLSLLGLVLGLVMSAWPAAYAAGGCRQLCESSGTVGTYDAGFAARGHHTTQSSIPGTAGSSAAQPAGPVIEYQYQPVCDGTCDTQTAQNVADMPACTGDAVAVWVSTRVAGSGADFAIQGAPECLTPAQQLAYDPGQIQAAVDDYFQRLPLPEPGLHVAPADNAVVNLPEIVSANAPAQTVFTVDIAPFPTVTITTNVQWLWDFGDGTRLETATPGRAYDAADNDLSHYVTHTYLKPSTSYPLSVTSIWSGTYTVEGLAGTQAVNGTVQRTTAHPLTAAEYAGTLTGN